MVNVAAVTTASIEIMVLGSGKITVTQGTFSDYTTTSKIVVLQTGTQAQFTFIPDKGWKFINWVGWDTSIQNPVIIDIETNGSVVANSEKISTDPFSQVMDWLSANPIASVAIFAGLTGLVVFSGKGSQTPVSGAPVYIVTGGERVVSKPS